MWGCRALEIAVPSVQSFILPSALCLQFVCVCLVLFKDFYYFQLIHWDSVAHNKLFQGTFCGAAATCSYLSDIKSQSSWQHDSSNPGVIQTQWIWSLVLLHSRSGAVLCNSQLALSLQNEGFVGFELMQCSCNTSPSCSTCWGWMLKCSDSSWILSVVYRWINKCMDLVNNESLSGEGWGLHNQHISLLRVLSCH